MSDPFDGNFNDAAQRILDGYGISGQPQLPIESTPVLPVDDMWVPTPALLEAERQLALLRMQEEALERMRKLTFEMLFPVMHHIPDPSDGPQPFIGPDGIRYEVYTSQIDRPSIDDLFLQF